MWVYVWLIITAVALVVEFITTDVVSIWFVGGGLVSLLLAILSVSWYIQVPVFIMVSFLSILLLRKILIKKLNNVNERTNAETVIGSEVRLLTSISFQKAGSIRVNGVIWTAIATDEKEEIEEGSIVKIVDLKGNKYIVEVVE